jgi:dihydrofolate reductase
MRKLIAAINMTLDGFCDHTAVTPDEEVHQHYTDLLRNAGDIIYGRVTYQLMENYWPTLVKKPSGNKSMDEFALAIDNIPKIVFSHTLKGVEWKTAKLAKRDLKEEVLELRQKAGKDILVGSPGLIISLMNLHLIDELQLCVHPVIAGKGLPLFKNISDRIDLKLLKTKTFTPYGAVLLYYEPVKK